MSLTIKLSRDSREYKEGERCSGSILVQTPSRMAHNGMMLVAHGKVQPILSSRNASVFGSSQIAAEDLLHTELPMVEGRDIVPFEPGDVEIPFEFVIEPVAGAKLCESYHGVYVNVVYTISVELKRSGMFARPLKAELEFFVHTPSASKPPAEPQDFEILPTSLENVRSDRLSAIPPFRVVGNLAQTNASLMAPFVGQIVVEESEEPIRSLELQLVRVEAVRHGGKSATERTEIQNLQVGDGDVPRGVPIPLYMILPRMFTAPSVRRGLFSVAFEVNIFVRFERHYLATLNIPITLYR